MATEYQHLDKFDSLDDDQELIDPIYEDKFCKLFPEKLVIMCYYFPTTKSKTVRVSDIKTVYYKKQVFTEDLLVAKGWGKSVSNIWWACNMSRRAFLCKLINKTCGELVRADSEAWFNIVIDNGEQTMKGFTSTNYEQFIDAIKPLLPVGAEIKHGMP